MNQALNRLLQENKTAFYVFDIGEAQSPHRPLAGGTAAGGGAVLCGEGQHLHHQGAHRHHPTALKFALPARRRSAARWGVPSENMGHLRRVQDAGGHGGYGADLDFSPIYTVESLEQYELFRRLAKQYGRTLPLLLRLTNGSQFGINKGDIEAIVARRGETPEVDILGIQFFSGTQKTSLKKLKREVGKLDDLLTLLEEKYGFVARELEYGPGLPGELLPVGRAGRGGTAVRLLGTAARHDPPPQDYLGAGPQHRRFLRHLLHPHCGLEADQGAELRPGGRWDAPPGVLRPAHGHEAAFFTCAARKNCRPPISGTSAGRCAA